MKEATLKIKVKNIKAQTKIKINNGKSMTARKT